MSERYFMERGDVLMSVHLVLAAEWERRPPTAALSLRRAVSTVAPKPTPRAVPKASSLTAQGPKRLAPAGLLDPATGAPDLAALRRDVRLAGGSAGLAAERSVLVGVRVVGLAGIAADQGASAANSVLRALIELAPFSLRGRDRVYRVAFDELAFMITSTFEEGAMVAMERFAEESERVLAARKLPPVELVPHPLEPAILLEAV